MPISRTSWQSGPSAQPGADEAEGRRGLAVEEGVEQVAGQLAGEGAVDRVGEALLARVPEDRDPVPDVLGKLALRPPWSAATRSHGRRGVIAGVTMAVIVVVVVGVAMPP